MIKNRVDPLKYYDILILSYFCVLSDFENVKYGKIIIRKNEGRL